MIRRRHSSVGPSVRVMPKPSARTLPNSGRSAGGRRIRILLINPPYVSLTSRAVGHQIPFGLLCIGGLHIDAGHTVELIDAEHHHLPVTEIERHVTAVCPDLVMTGHAGSTPAHPACLEALGAAKRACPGAVTVYGGPYPSYHAADVLAESACVDVIVHGEGEGEVVARTLAECLARHSTERAEEKLTKVFEGRGGDDTLRFTYGRHAELSNLG